MKREQKYEINRPLLKALLKQKKMTQKELAIKLKVQEKEVSRWTKGKNFPEQDRYLNLCKFLGIKPDKLKVLKNNKGTIDWKIPFIIVKSRPIMVILSYLVMLLITIYAVIQYALNNSYNLTGADIKFIAYISSNVAIVVTILLTLFVSVICHLIGMIKRVTEEFKRNIRLVKIA